MAEYIVKPYNDDDEETIIREWHPEELIRCKDCKHRFDGETTKNCCDRLMEFTQWTREIDVDLDFYCGYGEPKDGE